MVLASLKQKRRGCELFICYFSIPILRNSRHPYLFPVNLRKSHPLRRRLELSGEADLAFRLIT